VSIRTLVVDDSVVVRRTVTAVLEASGCIDVVGTARDGRVGIEQIERLNPDVVTLDVEMPDMDGLLTLAVIRERWPLLPVIMYSALTATGAETTLTALSLGAVDYATKPTEALSRTAACQQVHDTLVPLIKLWGGRHASARDSGSAPPVSPVPVPPVPTHPVSRAVVVPPVRGSSRSVVQLVVVGVSTGGPDALARILPMLPADLGVPVVMVQHMPPIFTTMFAKRLNGISAIPVSEVTEQTELAAGRIYLAAGGRHLRVTATPAGRMLVPDDGPPENSCRPAVDVLFRSAAATVGANLLAVVLTGMGQDGLIGAEHVTRAGGSVLAQDEQSSVVWGMPGFVARAGLARAVLPLDAIPQAIAAAVQAPAPSAVGTR